MSSEIKVDGLSQKEFIQRDIDKANYFIGRGSDAEGNRIRSAGAYMSATISNAESKWEDACAS